MIIGLCGGQGAGKSTFASILVKNHGFTEVTFATVIATAKNKPSRWGTVEMEIALALVTPWKYSSTSGAVPDFARQRIVISDPCARPQIDLLTGFGAAIIKINRPGVRFDPEFPEDLFDDVYVNDKDLPGMESEIAAWVEGWTG